MPFSRGEQQLMEILSFPLLVVIIRNCAPSCGEVRGLREFFEKYLTIVIVDF